MEIILFVLLLACFLLLLLLLSKQKSNSADALLLSQLEEKHRAMLLDLNDGLNKLGDRLNLASQESSERLRTAVAQELAQTREAMQSLQLAQNASLAQTRETVLEKLHVTLAEQGKAEQELIQGTYEMQYAMPNGTRVDCALFLPEPTGLVAVDSKFPLENYHRMYEVGISEVDRVAAQRQFKADVKKHVDDIASKYIIQDVTSDGAVMFIPAEAVFAEIHAYHSDVVDYAMSKRVWVVSPTTLMAVLNTARAVLKDVETRKQVHIIKDELGKLGKEFGRFDTRMKKLADHIRQAHEDAQDVQTTSQKISRRFSQIERVELEGEAERLSLANADLNGLDDIDAEVK
ncbi:MAG: DNA recombination protein RmuC [Methylophilaceae bacterium]|nr:DNA recombination protein RmuC [Methylophilaceae bacterium]